MERVEKHLDGCLLAPENAKMLDSKGAVLVCGLCPNRSDMVGNLGDLCKMAPGNK